MGSVQRMQRDWKKTQLESAGAPTKGLSVPCYDTASKFLNSDQKTSMRGHWLGIDKRRDEMCAIKKILRTLQMKLGCMRCGGDMKNGKCVECGWYEGA